MDLETPGSILLLIPLSPHALLEFKIFFKDSILVSV